MKKASIIIILVASGAFIFGIVRLFHLRFEAGDIYPQYSSLRADPLGTKALYESVDQLLPVRRLYQPIHRLSGPPLTTVVYLGVRQDRLELTGAEIQQWEAFVLRGGRLIIATLPGQSSPSRARPPTASKPREDRTFLGDQWGFSYDHMPLRSHGKDVEPAMARRKTDTDLPISLLWRSSLCFTNLDDAWKVIYEREGARPVLIERRFGSGSIVLSSDAYPFSNEALATERRPELLAWCLGSPQLVVFDEHHLGVQASQGVATLARKYRLHGVFAALLVLALLFIWKNASSLVPARSVQGRIRADDLVEGRDTTAGFINLLRRNIPATKLLAVCLAEWKHCAREIPRPKLEKVQAIIDATNQLPISEQNPVHTYREIARTVARTK